MSLLFSILGTINYQGEILTTNNASKFVIGLNDVIYQILIAYITGLILLFLFELFPKTKKRVAISTALGNNVLLIKERVKYLLNEIGKSHPNTEKRFELNEYTLRECCQAININVEIVRVWYYPDYSFREFVIKSCEEIKTAANETLGYADILTENWIYSLSKVIGASDKVIKSFEVRFPVPKLEFYWLWGLYAETERLMGHLKKFNEAYFKLAVTTSPPFHPIGLTFAVNRDD